MNMSSKKKMNMTSKKKCICPVKIFTQKEDVKSQTVPKFKVGAYSNGVQKRGKKYLKDF